MFLAFIALSRVPATDVKILATALALGIIIDATIVRGLLAPALVAVLGPANWWTPARPRNPGEAAKERSVGGGFLAEPRVSGTGMGDYERSTTVQVPPARLFSYLADVENLPRYLPRLTSATPAHGDRVDVTAHVDPPDGPARDVQSEAWLKVVTDGRSLQWGAAGPGGYHGELDVDPGSDQFSSRLTVRLHTERVEGPSIDDGLDETMRGLKHAIEQTGGR